MHSVPVFHQLCPANKFTRHWIIGVCLIELSRHKDRVIKFKCATEQLSHRVQFCATIVAVRSCRLVPFSMLEAYDPMSMPMADIAQNGSRMAFMI
eukprot:scaffold648031_cov34-Prasinocladus_malaysianus.AAC.1